MDYLTVAWAGIGCIVAVVWAATSDPRDKHFEPGKGGDMLCIVAAWPFMAAGLLILVIYMLLAQRKYEP